MQGYYPKKRRGPTGPNKNEQKAQRTKEGEGAGLSSGVLGTRFPFVKRLNFSLQFLSPQGQILDEKVKTVNPNDKYSFTVSCPGRCGSGSFNFGPKLEEAVEARRALTEATGTCRNNLYAGSAEVCGCQCKCRIEIAYLPAPAAEPQ